MFLTANSQDFFFLHALKKSLLILLIIVASATLTKTIQQSYRQQFSKDLGMQELEKTLICSYTTLDGNQFTYCSLNEFILSTAKIFLFTLSIVIISTFFFLPFCIGTYLFIILGTWYFYKRYKNMNISSKPSKTITLQIRPATPFDIPTITQLFYDTITTINTEDYTPNQIAIWSSASSNVAMWQERMQNEQFFVAEIDNIIVGFSSLGKNGYLDFMYVHKDYQHQGIASALLNKIIEITKTQNVTALTTEASITAKPFFEKRGFEAVKQQTKTVKETEFVNYIMRKKI